MRRRRLSGFDTSHISHSPILEKKHHLQRNLRSKWGSAKSYVHKKGIQEVWYPSDSVKGSGARPIFKRKVDPAEILGQVGVLMATDLSAGDRQILGIFLNRCCVLKGNKRIISLPHNILSDIRQVAGMIKSGDYDPDTRPPPRKKAKKSQAAVNVKNPFVIRKSKKSLESALE